MTDISADAELEENVIVAKKSTKAPQSKLQRVSKKQPLDLSKGKEPLPSLQSHCKTRTFIAKSGTNPLTAAASALFSLMSKLRQQPTYDDIDSLRHNLIHEIKAFEWIAQTKSYSGDEILVARYAICATLDEIIQNTAWGEENHWHEHNLLYFFQGEIWGGERFFLILERLRESPTRYIDLLEFIYICLSLGFEGKFRVIEKGKEQLESIIDELYHIIRKQRKNPSNRLSKQAEPYKKIQQSHHKLFPLWSIILTGLTILGLLYGGYSYITQVTTKPIYQAYNTITAMDVDQHEYEHKSGSTN